jgi:hypothetical protein
MRNEWNEIQHKSDTEYTIQLRLQWSRLLPWHFGFSLLSCVHQSAFSKFHQQSWDSGSWQTKIATVAKQTTNQKMKNKEWSWETTAIKSISYNSQSFVVSYNSQPCSSIVPKLKEIDLLYL